MRKLPMPGTNARGNTHTTPLPAMRVFISEDSNDARTRAKAVLPYAFALLAVAAALSAGKIVEPMVGLETIDLIFLTAVLVVAAGFGLMPSLFASIAASLA